MADETIEQVAERLYPDHSTLIYKAQRAAFISGAMAVMNRTIAHVERELDAIHDGPEADFPEDAEAVEANMVADVTGAAPEWLGGTMSAITDRIERAMAALRGEVCPHMRGGHDLVTGEWWCHDCGVRWMRDKPQPATPAQRDYIDAMNAGRPASMYTLPRDVLVRRIEAALELLGDLDYTEPTARAIAILLGERETRE